VAESLLQKFNDTVLILAKTDSAIQKKGDFMKPNNKPNNMFDCVCSNCGEDTKVPFQPDGKRPVYCRDCLQKNRQKENNHNAKNFGGKKMVRKEEEDEDYDNDDYD